MRARIYGALFLAFAAVAGWLVFSEGFRRARAIVVVPLFGATGLWMLIFGYPVREDGLAPAWWRLGLVGVVIASCLGTCVALD